MVASQKKQRVDPSVYIIPYSVVLNENDTPGRLFRQCEKNRYTVFKNLVIFFAPRDNRSWGIIFARALAQHLKQFIDLGLVFREAI